MEPALTLPGGLWREGALLRKAWLAPLTGADEEALLEPAEPWRSRAAAVDALIARGVRRLGDMPMTPELAQQLSVGDREALLLAIRRVTLGERIDCIVDCPACGERMDLEFGVESLLLPPYAEPQPDHRVEIECDGVAWHVRLRLPTGADQAAVAELARADLAAAETALLERCVLEVRAADGAPLAVRDLAPRARTVLAERAGELDPQAEMRLDFTCPACGTASAVIFDAADYLLQELVRGDLCREVHTLALHYHWSEQEILGLPQPRRRRYLALLAEAQGPP